MTFETIAGSPVGSLILDLLIGDVLEDARSMNDFSEAALYEIVTYAASTVSDEKWSSLPARLNPWERRASRADVEQLGQQVVACNSARWWSGAVFDRPQVWNGPAGVAPTSGMLTRGLAGKPSTTIWTSSALAGEPSAWWPVMKDGADGPAPDGPQSIWQLTPFADARVFEIRVPEDWRWLCDAFPGPSLEGNVLPDWEAAREQFDGIHLTVEGLIRAQGVVVDTNRGPAMLDDWDAEATAWLQWPFVAVERLGTITVARQPEVRRERRHFRRRPKGATQPYRS